MICDNLSVGNDGILYFAGKSTSSLAAKYGTPLYLMDEQKIRHNCRVYVDSVKKYFGESALVLLASKANSFKQIYRIANEEGMGTDVVSSGELYTAKSVGFPMDKVYFHGNNKTDADISYAIDCGVGCFVADSFEEIESIDRIAGEKGIRQKILIRLTPGIDPHTYEAVATGKVDSKFGSAISTGEAERIMLFALSKKNIDLCGFHCHVGSQVFDSDVYFASSEIMLGFIAEMKKKHGFEAIELNLGGGYGVRYTDGDPVIDIADNIKQVSVRMKEICLELGIDMPAIRMEPGRSIVADAGLTLYTAGSVKRIPGFKNYVSVDGGMADNPRYALYGSAYTVYVANKMNEKSDFVCSVVGRCCESGDIIQENVKLPDSVRRGDLIAVLTTGAYNYSMSSNYNRLGRPPVVMLNGEDDYIAVKRESFEDIAKNDV